MRRHTIYALVTTPVLAGLIAVSFVWERGAEGTSARSHAGSAQAGLSVTVGALTGPSAARTGALVCRAQASSPRAGATDSTSAVAGRHETVVAAASAGEPKPGARAQTRAAMLASLRRQSATDKTISVSDLAAEIGTEVNRIRADLRSPDLKVRLAAIRSARDLDAPELRSDITVLLDHETQPTVRTVATQALAQGDPLASEELLRNLAQKDPSPLVRLNATFGLARAGDEAAQAQLLAACDSAHTDPKAPAGSAAILGVTLEDPALKSAAVIARFQQVAANPLVPAPVRAHARQVLVAKGALPGS